VKTGFDLMFVAGAVSGLLGIGSGALKVVAMDRAMRIAFKVPRPPAISLVGVTAAASAGLYLNRGYPGLTGRWCWACSPGFWRDDLQRYRGKL
jgi:uncharacterized protein